MEKITAPLAPLSKSVSTPTQGGSTTTTATSGQVFLGAAITMSWQLAIVVLVPIIGGVQLDKALGTKYACTFIGLALALAGSAMVTWRAMQVANRLPVPKLTAAQKRAIQKQYAEDDD